MKQEKKSMAIRQGHERDVEGQPNRRRQYLGRGLAAFGLAANFASAQPASTSEAASGPSSIRTTFASTVKGFTRQIVEDYFHAGQKRTKTYVQGEGQETIEVSYPARKGGRYLLIATLDRSASGGFKLGSTEDVTLQAINSGRPVFYLNAQVTDTEGDWDLQEQISQDGTFHTASYTTGAAKPKDFLPALTTQTLTPIEGNALMVLDAAKNQAPIGSLTLTLPPAPTL